MCRALNKSTGNATSQLGILIPDFDQVTNNFDNWSEARLIHTLGSKSKVVAAGGDIGNGSGGIKPVFQINIPMLPQPGLSQMDMAYN